MLETQIGLQFSAQWYLNKIQSFKVIPGEAGFRTDCFKI